MFRLATDIVVYLLVQEEQWSGIDVYVCVGVCVSVFLSGETEWMNWQENSTEEEEDEW